MRFYKSFLMEFILLLGFNQKVLTMEDDHPDFLSTLKTECLSNLPVEIQVHIFSFLNHQKDLLRAGGISKTWRQAAEMVWNNKPLNLSKKRLTKGDYKAIVKGPFSLLVLQSVRLGEKEANILTR
ncbi:MAG: F-box protein, partial [Alphaproteobacteria bacterium]|nr:F-box protein [Alphaproteobacteria bacterium]